LPFQKKKDENFLDPQSILFEPFESLNTGPSDLFPSDMSGASEWQSALSFESPDLLKAHLSPQHEDFLQGMLILTVDPTTKTSQLLRTEQRGLYQNNM
jgi:hypothetical protein